MSDSTTSRSVQGYSETVPRAVVHKKILDVAASRPDATMEDIADVVSGATTSIVERVLGEYGDPAYPSDGDGDPTDDAPGPEPPGASESESGSGDESMSTYEDRSDDRLGPVPDPEDVTEKQLETLREIESRPDATQAELADTLGVSSATINQRVNAIDGFDWSRRHAFVELLFEGESESDEDADPGENAVDERKETDGDEREEKADGDEREEETNRNEPDEETTSDEPELDLHDAPVVESAVSTPRVEDGRTDGSGRPDAEYALDRTGDSSVGSGATLQDLTEQIDRLARRLESFEDRLSNGGSQSSDVLADPEFAHKIVHACFSAEHISEEEELRLLKTITAGDSVES